MSFGIVSLGAVPGRMDLGSADSAQGSNIRCAIVVRYDSVGLFAE